MNTSSFVSDQALPVVASVGAFHTATGATLTTCILGLVAVFLYSSRVAAIADKKLPPGPKGLPVIGNLHQVPVLRPYPQFRQWAKQYGPLFSLRLGAQPVVVLNTAKAADELLNVRAAKYSSRAPPHVAHDIMSDGQRMVFLPYNDEWKVVKKQVQTVLGPAATKRLAKIQELESRVVLYDLMAYGQGPDFPSSLAEKDKDKVPDGHWFGILRRYTTSVVMYATYGHRVDRVLNRPQVTKIYDVLANFAHVGQPGNYLADVFAIFRLLPDFLARWRVEARKMHEWEMELWGSLLEGAKRLIRQGQPNDSFVHNHLCTRMEAGYSDTVQGSGITSDGFMKDKLLAYSAATLLEAGSDTTASSLQNIILFLLSHPAALARAQAEVDAAVGVSLANGAIGRMPEFEDEEKCPWLMSCIVETLRRRPPTIMGIPHSTDEEDTYMGMRIPKGCTIIGNVWTINHDPSVFPNPMAWLPERHMPREPNDKVNWGAGPAEQDRKHYVFGWGRRFCPGYRLAHASFFIILARLLWSMDISPLHDAQTAKPMLPDINDEESFTTGFVSVPRIFGVSFQPRSPAHKEAVLNAFAEAQLGWEAMGLDKDDR